MYNFSFIQIIFSGIFMFTFISCNSLKKNPAKPSAVEQVVDSCAIAKPFENISIVQSMVAPGYTGVLNNYWGKDSTKLDFQHYFEKGILLRSIFYYENGKMQEAYSYKCGALNGIQKYYYSNGKLSKTIPYSYGYREGIGNMYDENGTLRQQATFIADSLIGEPKSFDEKGKPLTQGNK